MTPQLSTLHTDRGHTLSKQHTGSCLTPQLRTAHRHSSRAIHSLNKSTHTDSLNRGTHTHTLFKRQLVCFPEVCVCVCVGSAQVVARQSVLSLKAAMRKMTLDEDEIEEVLARAGLQPEEPQYGAFSGFGERVVSSSSI
jgi:hypothetical protein